jgi:hypothetical protein
MMGKSSKGHCCRGVTVTEEHRMPVDNTYNIKQPIVGSKCLIFYFTLCTQFVHLFSIACAESCVQ